MVPDDKGEGAVSRPRNDRTPKAKAAGSETASLPSVIAPATTTEFMNQVPTG